MFKNKNGEGKGGSRVKTLQCAYTCGRDHGISAHLEGAIQSAHTSKLKQMISRKLNNRPNNQRLATLQNSPSKIEKLNTIKEAKWKGKPMQKIQLDEDEKQGRLRQFLQSNQQLLENWKEKETKEKKKFKSRLKLAAIPSHKSLDKVNKEMKKSNQSLKNLHQKYQKWSLIPSPGKNFHIKPPKGSNGRLDSLQSQAYKYYLQKLLGLMQENKQQLLESRKLIKKQIKREEKEHIITSKKELVQQIEQQLMSEHESRKEESLQRYRRELEAELEQELSQQQSLPIFTRYPIQHQPQPQPQPQPQFNNKKKVVYESNNPEHNVTERKNSTSIVGRSKSMAQMSHIHISAGLSSISALTEKQQQKCIKIIEKYDIGGSHKNPIQKS